MSSTASTSTVKAQRGSPPPPETPIIPPPGGGIEARFAAAGIAGTSTLTNLQAQSAQNAAAAQRNQVYANQQPRPVISSPTPSQQQPQPIRRPWTPTEQPGQTPYGQPQVYQGMGEAQPGASSTPPQGPLPQAPNGAGNVSSPPPSSPQASDRTIEIRLDRLAAHLGAHIRRPPRLASPRRLEQHNTPAPHHSQRPAPVTVTPQYRCHQSMCNALTATLYPHLRW